MNSNFLNLEVQYDIVDVASTSIETKVSSFNIGASIGNGVVIFVDLIEQGILINTRYLLNLRNVDVFDQFVYIEHYEEKLAGKVPPYLLCEIHWHPVKIID